MHKRPLTKTKLSFSLRSSVLFSSKCSCLLLVLFAHSPALAQDSESPGQPIRWWHGALVAGGTAMLFLVDEPVQQSVQGGRSPALDKAAHGFRQLGEPLVAYSASLGALGVGLLRDDAALERTGARMTTSITVAAALFHAGKLVFGRDRPNVSGQALNFNPFSGLTDKSFPSGHTAVAFALATALADDIDNTAATVSLFALASGTGWSRINDDKHWTSDVALGAVVGIASAKLVNGHWTIFGIDTPSYLKGKEGQKTGFGEVMVGMGAGVGLYYLTSRVMKDLHFETPVVAPSIDGGFVVGSRWRF